MNTYIQLPFNFHPQLLQEDLKRIHPTDWKEIPTNYANKEAMWGIDLFVPDLEKLIPGESIVFKASPVLERCAYFQQVLEQFASCEILKARLNLLKAGEGNFPHMDPYGYGTGQVRLHIPIVTNPKFVFYVDGEGVFLPEGECWYINTRLQHHVENNGSEDRVHLVVDCLVDEWLEGVFMDLGFPSLEEARRKGSQIQIH